jgi:hypothetical protein
MRPTATPTLAEIAAHPELVDQLSGSVAGVLALEASGLVQRLTIRAVTAPPRLGDGAPDELWDTKTAARHLGMSLTSLHHRARQEPYRSLRVDNGTRRLCWSRRRIEAFLAEPAMPAPVEGGPNPDERSRILPVPPPRRGPLQS